MKKYLFMLSTALLCLGLVASCDKDDEKEKEMEKEEATQKYDNGTPKFLTGGWMSEGEMKIYTSWVGDTVYRYYFLYVDEVGECEMGYDEFLDKADGMGLSAGPKYHGYHSSAWIRQTKDGRLAAPLQSQTTMQYATLTSRTDTTLTFEKFFLWGPMELKKTEVRSRWK